MSAIQHNRFFHLHMNEATKQALIVFAFFATVVTLTLLFFF
ncbi:MAG: hypothetical protein ACK5DG_00205 [Chitinophagaceae bacterium]